MSQQNNVSGISHMSVARIILGEAYKEIPFRLFHLFPLTLHSAVSLILYISSPLGHHPKPRNYHSP